MENLETTNQRIAKNLIYYRKAANLTQAELAQKINYSDKSVSKWESGNGVPDIYILLKLADLYGITVNDLVCEKSSVLPLKKCPNGGDFGDAPFQRHRLAGGYLCLRAFESHSSRQGRMVAGVFIRRSHQRYRHYRPFERLEI